MEKRYHWKTEKEYQNISDAEEEIKVICKGCQHRIIIPVYIDNVICRWCGAKVINNTKQHFIKKMLDLLNKQKEGEKNGRNIRNVK